MNILIIGAGAGLSRCVAHLFGEKGFSVSLVARSEEKLKNEVSLLQAKGITADYFIADVSNEQSLTNVLNRFKHDNRLPDIVLFNAFTNAAGGLAEETWDNLKKELDVNVGAAFNLLKDLLPSYQQSGKGNLFFTGGGFGVTPSPDYLGVGLGKAALRNLVQAVATQMKGTNIHVATITVMGLIGGEDPQYDPSKIAEVYWKLYNQQADQFDVEIIY